jgi:proline iminopeptidase
MNKIIITLLTVFITFTSFAKDSTFHFTTSDSVNLYVRMAGEGRPCVFVHGGPGSTAYYFEQMQAAPLIEQHLKMIYFDQRGSGRSGSARNGDYSLGRMIKDIEELKKALGYKQWAVMGHSFAGILLTNYAYRYPQSVAALMMINTTVNMTYSMNSHLEFGLKTLGITDQREYRDTTKPLMQRVSRVHDGLTEKNLWYKLMFRNAWEKKYSDSVTLSISHFNWEFGQKVWDNKDYFTDFAPLTARIKCPVLVMVGDKDYAIGTDHYKSFHFPRAKVVHYIGGHAPFQEEPQWFAEKIIDFVSTIK